jgi:hypothetical protein
MSTEQLTDAEAFHRFLGEQLENGGRETSPEELLRLWRSHDDPEYAQAVAALREAISDLEAGDRGKPFDQFVAEFRKKHNIPQDE